jgi:hypothetical protein
LVAISHHGQHRLGNATVSMTRRRHRQHDSTSTSRNDLIVDINNGI